MKRRAALLLSTAIAFPALAEEAPIHGSAAFAGGSGHVTFWGGIVEVGVDPIAPDGLIVIDGAAVDLGDGDDTLGGDVFGGALSFVLPGQDDGGWFGRNLRLDMEYERLKADERSQVQGVGPTIDTSFELVSVSADGHAIGRSLSATTLAEAAVFVFDPAPGSDTTCNDASGPNTAQAIVNTANGGAATCTATPTSATAQAAAIDGSTARIAFANAAVLSGTPIATEYVRIRRQSVETRRGQAGIAGDHPVSEALTLVPSLALTIAETTMAFNSAEFLADDLESITFGAIRAAQGTLNSHDAGLRLGVRADYAAGGGFTLFAGATAAVLRRKTVFAGNTIMQGIVNGEATVALTAIDNEIDFRLRDSIAAFQSGLEVGAAYAFDPALGIGRLRFALTGGLVYDSDVATYGNIGDVPATVTGPIAPAHIAYTGETTFTLKGAITFELP